MAPLDETGHPFLVSKRISLELVEGTERPHVIKTKKRRVILVQNPTLLQLKKERKRFVLVSFVGNQRSPPKTTSKQDIKSKNHNTCTFMNIKVGYSLLTFKIQALTTLLVLPVLIMI